MTLTQIVETIKQDKVWTKVFENAKYWEEIRDELFYAEIADQDNEEKYDIAHRQFMHYFRQFGIVWTQWEELKKII